VSGQQAWRETGRPPSRGRPVSRLVERAVPAATVGAILLTGCGGAHMEQGRSSAAAKAPAESAASPLSRGTVSGSPGPRSIERPRGSSGEVSVGWVDLDGRRIEVLETAAGGLLYEFSPDGSTAVHCTASGPDGGCTRTWAPVILATGRPWSRKPLPGRLGLLQAADGRQVTYAGHPLYTNRASHAGQVAAAPSYDGQWFFLVTPDIAPPRGCPPIC